MKVAHSPGELELRPRAVAIGTFDGVHLGHRAVLAAAQAAGLLATAVTFEPHPRIAFGYEVELLTTLERRLELIGDAGIPEALVVEFDHAFSQQSPEEFVERVLRPLGAEVVVAGGQLPLRPGPRRRPGDAARARHRRARGPARRGRVVEQDPRPRARRRDRARGQASRPASGARRAGGRRGCARRRARVPDREPAPRSAPVGACVRDLRGRRARPPRGDLDRHEPALRR